MITTYAANQQATGTTPDGLPFTITRQGATVSLELDDLEPEQFPMATEQDAIVEFADMLEDLHPADEQGSGTTPAGERYTIARRGARVTATIHGSSPTDITADSDQEATDLYARLLADLTSATNPFYL